MCLALLLVGWLMACGTGDRPPGIVATVGSQAIVEDDLADVLRERDRPTRGPLREREREALALLVHAEWVEQEAEARGIRTDLGHMPREIALQTLAAAIEEDVRRDGATGSAPRALERFRDRFVERGRAKTECEPGYRIAACSNAAPPAGGPRGPGSFLVNGFVGDVPGGAGGAFVEPSDVAVFEGNAGDPADDKVFVVEGLRSNSRVQRLDANGNFELAWGKDAVRRGGYGDRGTSFEVCGTATSCKRAPAGRGRGELDRPAGIAVSPATGRVYVLDAGNQRVQEFRPDGRPVRRWDISGGRPAVSRDEPAKGGIAVAPRPPHDVFVGDAARNRVLQFRANGQFVRGWGWGVDDGRANFQSCRGLSGCRAGHIAGRGTARPYWPNHLTVDENDVVYGSVFLGSIFDGDNVRTRIERFRHEARPADVRAETALLEPLSVEGPANGLPTAGRRGSPILTNGATEGLEIDATSGDLLAFTNPFGVSVLDIVRDPGSDRPRRRPLPRGTNPPLTFLQNVTGMGLAAGGRVILLSSGTVRPETGPSSFTGCRGRRRESDCHGLVALSPGGRPLVAIAGPIDGSSILAWVNAGGVAASRLEVSSDGRTWKPVGDPRYVMGTTYEPAVLEHRLPPGEYRLRVAVRKKKYPDAETSMSRPISISIGK